MSWLADICLAPMIGYFLLVAKRCASPRHRDHVFIVACHRAGSRPAIGQLLAREPVAGEEHTVRLKFLGHFNTSRTKRSAREVCRDHAISARAAIPAIPGGTAN